MGAPRYNNLGGTSERRPGVVLTPYLKKKGESHKHFENKAIRCDGCRLLFTPEGYRDHVPFCDGLNDGFGVRKPSWPGLVKDEPV